MKKVHGLTAEFANPAELLVAAKKIREADYHRFDCHSPFPIHGMDAAMGLRRSPLGFIIGMCAIFGGLVGLGLQTWIHSFEYPLIISGKPFFAWQGYIIVTFALTILFGAFGAVLGMFKLNRIPKYHHPHFFSNILNKFSDDGFFISIDADDPKFDPNSTTRFCKSLGCKQIELMEEE